MKASPFIWAVSALDLGRDPSQVSNEVAWVTEYLWYDTNPHFNLVSRDVTNWGFDILVTTHSTLLERSTPQYYNVSLKAYLSRSYPSDSVFMG
jgi:hypothetical protein